MASVSATGLFGSEKVHFEGEIGAAIVGVEGPNRDNMVLPVVRAGYRYQRDSGVFIFRIGAGVIDGVYLSVGVAAR